MCNEYEFQTKWEEYVELMAALQLGMPSSEGPADLPQLASIRIGDIAPIIRAAGNGVELAPMRFGFPPPRPKASPVFNFRSGGRSFANSNRCLIPATGFFEFTGTKSPKTKHRFWMDGSSTFAIAGLWRDSHKGPAFTMLTTDPGPDVAPIHDRQVVVLPPSQWSAWLYLTKPESELLKPAPEGSLRHEVVERAGSA